MSSFKSKLKTFLFKHFYERLIIFLFVYIFLFYIHIHLYFEQFLIVKSSHTFVVCVSRIKLLLLIIAFVNLDFVVHIWSMGNCITRHSYFWDLNSKRKAHIIENRGLKICIMYLKQSALDKQTVDLYDATVLKKSKGVDNSTKATIWCTHVHVETSLIALSAVKAELSWAFFLNQPRPTRRSAKRNRCINATPFVVNVT